MNEHSLSTFEREMLDPVFAQEFEIGYAEFLANELTSYEFSSSGEDNCPHQGECGGTCRS